MSNNFWNEHYSKFNISEPSDFAKFCVEKHFNLNNLVIEFGCGNGRDGMYFLRNNFNYVGYDISPTAIKKFNESLISLDYQPEVLNKSFVDFKINNNEEVQIYSRFTLHSIDLESQMEIIKKLKKLKNKFTFYLEVRTIHDELFGKGKSLKKNEFIDTHFRRFIDPKEFIELINTNFNINYYNLSRYLAVYKDENPKVMRMIFSN